MFWIPMNTWLFHRPERQRALAPDPSQMKICVDALGSMPREKFPGAGSALLVHDVSFWFNAFGSDGGPAAKTLTTKFDLLSELIDKFDVKMHKIEVKHVVAAGIALKGIEGILFLLSSSVGAYLLLLYMAVATPISHSFEKTVDTPELLQNVAKDLTLPGALIFFLGLRNLILRRQSKKKPPKPKTM